MSPRRSTPWLVCAPSRRSMRRGLPLPIGCLMAPVAESAQTFHQCLLSHLPPSPDLILLEFGSMARHLHLQATEALCRRLLALPSSPHLVFLTVRELCPTAHLGFGHPVPDYAPQQKTVHSWAEASFGSRATMANRHSRTTTRSPHCFTPTRPTLPAPTWPPTTCTRRGRRGSGYMASMLTNWLRAARARRGCRNKGARAAKRCATAVAPRQALNGKVYIVRQSLLALPPHAAMHTPPIWGTHVSAPSTAAWDTDACPPLPPPPPPPPSRRCKAARSRHCISLRRRSNSSSLAQCGACPVARGPAKRDARCDPKRLVLLRPRARAQRRPLRARQDFSGRALPTARRHS